MIRNEQSKRLDHQSTDCVEEKKTVFYCDSDRLVLYLRKKIVIIKDTGTFFFRIVQIVLFKLCYDAKFKLI